MSWGSKWSKQNLHVEEIQDDAGNATNMVWPTENAGKAFKDVWNNLKKANEEVLAITGIDKIEKIYNNQMPTHDPYKNPNAHIYYQCSCGAIFDPGTKRFAELNHKASEAGWKIRWGANGYIPYCVDCGKDVE